MKKLLTQISIYSILASFFFFGSALKTYAADINNGSNTGDVIINGTLGADNTDPDSDIPEGDTSWINVTVDTATIFYNTSSSTEIKSPKYSIVNNSGRPVTVTPTGIEQTNSVDISSISNLSVNMTRNDSSASSSGASLVTNGNASVSGASSMTLANNVGQLSSTDSKSTTPTNNAAKFAYSGSVSSKLTSTIKPTFMMTLTFSSVGW